MYPVVREIQIFLARVEYSDWKQLPPLCNVSRTQSHGVEPTEGLKREFRGQVFARLSACMIYWSTSVYWMCIVAGKWCGSRHGTGPDKRSCKGDPR
jgi:hypothetical protein